MPSARAYIALLLNVGVCYDDPSHKGLYWDGSVTWHAPVTHKGHNLDFVLETQEKVEKENTKGAKGTEEKKLLKKL